MSFRVGDRVVCIRDRPWIVRPFKETFPDYRGVYTIRAIAVDEKGTVGFMFQEIVNRLYAYDTGINEVHFAAFNFRPVVTRKTDISVFKAMLTPSKVDA